MQDFKNIIGIIAEYNPFHNGHLYMLQTAKAKFKDAACVIVLSSNFTQRGEPSLLDKFARAEMALANGADLVLELPFFFSCAAAQDFSSGAIDILAGLKLVNYIAFGLEDFNYANLDELINILIQEPDEFKNNLKINLAQGMSYTRAASRALNKIIPDSEEFLLQPNNLLAISYLKRIKERDYNLKPLFIPRVGAAHGEKFFASAQVQDEKIFANEREGAAKNFCESEQGQDEKFFMNESEGAAENFCESEQGQDEKFFANESEGAAENFCESEQDQDEKFFVSEQGQDEKIFASEREGAAKKFSSSSAIREAIKINSLKILNNYMPEASLKIFERESLKSRVCINANKKLWMMLQAILLRASPDELKNFDLINNGLENLFLNNFKKFNNLEDFINSCVSSRYTRSHIRRCLMRILIGINKLDALEIRKTGAGYARVLGFNAKGREILKFIRKSQELEREDEANNFNSENTSGLEDFKNLKFITRLAAADKLNLCAKYEFKAESFYELLLGSQDLNYEVKLRTVEI